MCLGQEVILFQQEVQERLFIQKDIGKQEMPHYLLQCVDVYTILEGAGLDCRTMHVCPAQIHSSLHCSTEVMHIARHLCTINILKLLGDWN